MTSGAGAILLVHVLSMTFDFGWFAMGRSGSVPLARASAANLPCGQEDVAFKTCYLTFWPDMLRWHMGAANNYHFAGLWDSLRAPLLRQTGGLHAGGQGGQGWVPYRTRKRLTVRPKLHPT